MAVCRSCGQQDRSWSYALHGTELEALCAECLAMLWRTQWRSRYGSSYGSIDEGAIHNARLAQKRKRARIRTELEEYQERNGERNDNL